MIEVVVNQLSADGMKFVRVISDRVVSEAFLWSMVPGASREFMSIHCFDTAALNLFYGEVTFPVRGVVEIPAQSPLSPSTGTSPQIDARSSRPFGGRVRKFAAWRMMDGEGYRMSEIIEFLSEWYFVQTKQRAQYAFVRSLPKNVERFTEVDGLVLLDADWVLEKTVMVGG